MHYVAEKQVSKDGYFIIDIVPAFLMLDIESFGFNEVVWFLDIMETKIIKGNSFDVEFIESCRFYCTEWADPFFGSPEDEVVLLQSWLAKLGSLKIQNILNTHKNNMPQQFTPRQWASFGIVN